MDESKAFYKDFLAQPIDYTVNETFNTDYEKMAYSKNTEELKERWRKQLKLATLSSLTDRLKLQENKAKGIKEEIIDENAEDPTAGDVVKTENAKATKAKETDEKPKTYEELEKATRESTKNR